MRKKGGGRNDGDWEKKLKYLRKIRILFQMPRMKVRKLKCKKIKARNAHAPFSIILVFEPPTYFESPHRILFKKISSLDIHIYLSIYIYKF